MNDGLFTDIANNIRDAEAKITTIEERIRLLDDVGVSTGTYKTELSNLRLQVAKWKNALEKRGYK